MNLGNAAVAVDTHEPKIEWPYPIRRPTQSTGPKKVAVFPIAVGGI